MKLPHKNVGIAALLYVMFIAVAVIATSGSWHFYVLLGLFVANTVHQYSVGMGKGGEIVKQVWGIPS